LISKRMNRFVAFCVGAAFLMASACALKSDVRSNIKVARAIPTELHLYYLYEPYIPKIGSMPSEYLSSYQISVEGLEGTPRFKVVEGKSANVTSDGLIRPAGTTWYYYNNGRSKTNAPIENYEFVATDYKEGVSTVRVTCGSFTQDIIVNVTSYSRIYANDRMKGILAEIITNGMSQYDKLDAITAWVAHNTNYSASYSSFVSMMLMDCGDCWASTETITTMCSEVGIEAWARRGNQDGGAGSGHMNAIAFIDGTFYIAEAGYSNNPAPRPYHVREEPLGFSVSGSTIYQYDGKNASVVIPSQINGKNITTLGNGKAGVFVNDGMTSLYIPATITSIGGGACAGADELEHVIVDSANTNYEFDDKEGILYTKGKGKIVFARKSITSITIDPHTTAIGRAAFYNCNVTCLVIPSNVKTLENQALNEFTAGEIVIEEGLETIQDEAFRFTYASKISLPNSVKSLGSNVFTYSHIDEVVFHSGLQVIPAETFAGSYVKSLKLPDTVTTIYNASFYSYNPTNITVPVTVKAFGSNIFHKSYTTHIFYRGSEAQWNQITFNETFDENKVIVHFNSPAYVEGTVENGCNSGQGSGGSGGHGSSTHTGGSSTHTGGSSAHTGGSSTHTGGSSTHTGGSSTHTGGSSAHTGGSSTHGTGASGSGSKHFIAGAVSQHGTESCLIVALFVMFMSLM